MENPFPSELHSLIYSRVLLIVSGILRSKDAVEAALSCSSWAGMSHWDFLENIFHIADPKLLGMYKLLKPHNYTADAVKLRYVK